MFYTPIAPSSDLDTLCSAVHHIRPDLSLDSMRDELTAPEFTSYDVCITSTFASASVMANIGFKGLVISGSAKATYFVLDIVATQKTAMPFNSGQGANVWGVGARIGFATAQVSGDAAFSLSGVAASATAKGSAVQMQATVIGGGALNNIAFFNNTVISFDDSSSLSLGQGVNELFRVMTDPSNSEAFQPAVIGIVPESEAPQQSFAISYQYGLRAINKGWDLSKALEKAPVDVPASLNTDGPGFALDSNIISGVYDSLGVGADSKPSSQQQKTAGELFDCGP